MSERKTYIGSYKVVRIFRNSQRRVVLQKGLTESEAQRIVRSFPDSDKSMVVYFKQFSDEKYFV